MAKVAPSRDIPFDKLVLSQSNVRRIKAGISVEVLAEDIPRCGLLQSLNLRPVLNSDGIKTGMFEIPAGGLRFQALSLLEKQKRLAKTVPIPCIVRDAASEILTEDDRKHAARGHAHAQPIPYVPVLARERSGMTMEQLVAFTVNPDHGRQVQL